MESFVLRLVPVLFLVCILELCPLLALTVEIGPGREDCYFEDVGMNQSFSVDYVVLSASHQGEEDIDFKLYGPRGDLMHKDRRESDGSYTFTPAVIGQYRVCFDNSFSHLSTKKVEFDVSAEDEMEDEARWNYDTVKFLLIEGPNEAQDADVKRITSRVRINMMAMQKMQRDYKGNEAKDYKRLQKKNERVGFWSFFNLVVLMVVGVIQVVMLKSLFDGKYKIQNLLKLRKIMENLHH